MGVASNYYFFRRHSVTENSLIPWLLGFFSIPSSAMFPELEVQEVIFRCTFREWAPQIWILFSCDFM